MGKKLTNNWGLKLVAILFALILWFAVINIDDPVVSETFKNVPVQLVNTEVLTNEGLTYEILDDSTVIDTITVFGPRTLVESLKDNDIVARADVKDITVTNTVAINVTVDTRNSSKITNIRSSREFVELNIEESKSKQFVINAVTSGKLASGYIVGGIELDQNRIRVSGPDSIVSQIMSAKVNVDIAESSSDVATYGTVRLYDKYGMEITSDMLVKSTEKVHINVDVIPTKYVPVKYYLVGEPARGYAVVEDAVSCDIMTVLVAGEPEVLRDIKEVLITGEELDISDSDAELEFKVSIKNYLPDNIILGDKEYDGKVTIKVPVEEVVTEVVELLKENIQVSNVPEGKQIKLVDVPDYTELEVTGTVSKIRSIMTGEVIGTIDIDEVIAQMGEENLSDGTYQIEVVLNVPAGVEHTPVKVTLQITQNT